MNAKLTGIIATALFHGALLALCVTSGLKYIYPPPEEKVMVIDFGLEPEPIEMETGIEPRGEDPEPEKEVELVKRAEAPEEASKPNVAEEAEVDEFGDVEKPEPPREKEINKRALFSAAHNTPQKDTLEQQTASRVSDALSKGHSKGNTNTGSDLGEPSVRLAGRNVDGALPVPSYAVNDYGRVVVRIRVNREGKVVSAIPGDIGTTTTSARLRDAAKQAALKARFNVAVDAPEIQEGTITYVFKLK